jgi:predicted PurR-regulated permease PerM
MPNAVRDRPEPRDEVILSAIRLGLLAFLVYWTFVLVQPFIAIIAWSTILAVALNPVYVWLTRLLNGRRILSAVLVTVLSFLAVLGPAAWFGLGLIDGLRTLAESLSLGSFTPPEPPLSIKSWPLVGESIYDFWSLASTNLAGALASLAPQLKPMARPVLSMATSAGEGIFRFLLALVLMGFLFVPGPRLVRGIRTFLIHIVAERGDEFLALAGETIRSVSRGVIGIAVLQSVLAGIGFRLAEIPAGGLLTALALFFSIIQIGAGIVIFAVVVWIWMVMDTTSALLLSAYLVPVAFLDNVLKPIVMGHGLKTPMLVIFVGVLGGTLAHGVVGLFVGPVVLAVAWQLTVAWLRDSAADAPGEDGAELGTPKRQLVERI